MQTHFLNVVTTKKDGQSIRNVLIKSLIKIADNFLSPPVDFKLIPFRNHDIVRTRITELIASQNTFIHNANEILVVDGGNGDGIFRSKIRKQLTAHSVIGICLSDLKITCISLA